MSLTKEQSDRAEQTVVKAVDAIKIDVLMLVALAGNPELITAVDDIARSIAVKALKAATADMMQQVRDRN